LHRYEEALVDLDRAIGLDDTDAWAIASRGEVYRSLHRYGQALADLDRADQLEPDDWREYQRALAYLGMNATDQAHAGFLRAIERTGDISRRHLTDWRNFFNLALYNLAAGNVEVAGQLYSATLANQPPCLSVDEAIEDLGNFLDVCPAHPHAQAMRGLLQRYVEGTR
jgi:tetratricopeptide (TPR) repeat protein